MPNHMPQLERRPAVIPTLMTDRRLARPVAIVALQSIAAIYFLIDGVDDLIVEARQGFSIGMAMECIVAVALLGGVVMGSRYIRRLTNELHYKERALADHIAVRFDEWCLTPGEGDVALFALKGCDVAEIARLRSAATGTVRSQLSQIYAKAGVTSQAMLLSLFIDDLLQTNPCPPGPPTSDPHRKSVIPSSSGLLRPVSFQTICSLSGP